MSVRSHIIAAKAYEKVNARKTFSAAGNYASLAHKLPVLILQNGLAQATGFLLAKGNDEHLALLDDLADVMREAGERDSTSRENLHQIIIDADVQRTMQLTRLALDASGWIKRYVQGVLRIDATGGSETIETGANA